MALDASWRRRVLKLLAAALALNRTAVLPPAWCACDIYWGGMEGCRAGGARTMALPFECPVDHIIDLPRWSAQTRIRWRPPRHLQHLRLRASRPVDVHKLSELSELSEITAGSSAGSSARSSATVSASAGRSPCQMLASLSAADRAFATSLLRYTRLFCFVEGRSPAAGEAAPCCTDHSLRTAWTGDDDPRGWGYLPCDWGLRPPELPAVGHVGGGCDAGPDGVGDVAWAGEPSSPRRPADGARSALTLAACSVDDSVLGDAEGAPGAQLLRHWVRHAIQARNGSAGGVLLLSSSSAAAALATEFGVAHRRLEAAELAAGAAGFATASTARSWAADAASCVSQAMSLIEAQRSAVILTTPAVAWLRDPSTWIECDGPGASQLQCAPLGPADAMVATDMLSARQDALYGGGYAKYGALDPSILVLRPTAAALGLAARWRDALLAEHASLLRAGPARHAAGGPSSWGSRASSLFHQIAADPRSDWPGLHEIEVVGVRQASRLFEVGVDAAASARAVRSGQAAPRVPDGQIPALLGRLPLGLFANGHGYWVQRTRRLALGFHPYAIRPQLAPLAASLESAELLQTRLRFVTQGCGWATLLPAAVVRYCVITYRTAQYVQGDTSCPRVCPRCGCPLCS